MKGTYKKKKVYCEDCVYFCGHPFFTCHHPKISKRVDTPISRVTDMVSVYKSNKNNNCKRFKGKLSTVNIPSTHARKKPWWKFW